MAPSSSHSQAVLPNSGTLVLDSIDRHEKNFEIFVSTNQLAICPLCQPISTPRHSGYTRRLGDLPWHGHLGSNLVECASLSVSELRMHTQNLLRTSSWRCPS